MFILSCRNSVKSKAFPGMPEVAAAFMNNLD